MAPILASMEGRVAVLEVRVSGHDSDLKGTIDAHQVFMGKLDDLSATLHAWQLQSRSWLIGILVGVIGIIISLWLKK